MLANASLEYNYDDEKIEEGFSLHRQHVEDRALAKAAIKQKEALFASRRKAFKEEEKKHAKIRKIARKLFPDQDDRIKLSLAGDAPEGMDRFVITALQTCRGLLEGHYLAKISGYGFSKQKIKTRIEGLEKFKAMKKQVQSGRKAKHKAVARKKTSAHNLHKYMSLLCTFIDVIQSGTD